MFFNLLLVCFFSVVHGQQCSDFSFTLKSINSQYDGCYIYVNTLGIYSEYRQVDGESYFGIDSSGWVFYPGDGRNCPTGKGSSTINPANYEELLVFCGDEGGLNIPIILNPSCGCEDLVVSNVIKLDSNQTSRVMEEFVEDDYDSSVVINLDSSYIGFIFFIISELVILKIVFDAQMKSLEKNMQKKLQAGQHIKLNVNTYGPFKINKHLGWKTSFTLVLPALIVFLLISFSELGISGTTSPIYEKKNILRAGGYFTLDSIGGREITDDYRSAPLSFYNVWTSCVDFDDNMVIGRELNVFYENDGDTETYGDVSCSSTDDIMIYTFSESDDDRIFNVDSNATLVYSAENKVAFFKEQSGVDYDYFNNDVYIYSANGSVCEEELCDSSVVIYLVDITPTGEIRLGDYAIIDIGDGSHEKWLIAYDRIGNIGYDASYGKDGIFIDGDIVVECIWGGCFEAIVEWLSSFEGDDYVDRNPSISKVSTFLEIWYEGLNYGGIYGNEGLITDISDITGFETSTGGYGLIPNLDSLSGPPPICDLKPEGYSDGWIIEDFDKKFVSMSCNEPITETNFDTGSTKNITRISIWAIIAVCTGVFVTIVYYFFTKSCVGYGLMSYSSIFKWWYLDSHPGKEWVEQTPIIVKLSGNKVTCKVSKSTDFVSEEEMGMSF